MKGLPPRPCPPTQPRLFSFTVPGRVCYVQHHFLASTEYFDMSAPATTTLSSLATDLQSLGSTPVGVAQLADIEQRLAKLEQVDRPDTNCLNLLVFEGTRDRLLAAFVMATGAAACGMQVTMFFTFWGTTALRKEQCGSQPKSLIERILGWMLPRTVRHTKLSQLDMCGLGRLLIAREMRKKHIADLPELLRVAAELGVAIRVCEMSMKLMGIQREELIEYPGLEFCGVAKFVDDAATANTTLFI
jgi:peroxiredoxin family protein